MCVVDQLEAVEIEERQAYGLSKMAATFQFPPQHFVEMAHIVKARGVVSDRELLNASHVVRILNGDGRVVGQNMQECNGVIGELIRARIEDLDCAMNTFAATKRQCDYRTQ